MWSHRQEERELKRAEMEIVKQKKQLKRTMKTYETSKSIATQIPLFVLIFNAFLSYLIRHV